MVLRGGEDVNATAIYLPSDVYCGYLVLHHDILHAQRILLSSGQIIPVPGDGNCGYYVLRMILIKHGLIDPGMAIGELCKGIYDYALQHEMEFIGHEEMGGTSYSEKMMEVSNICLVSGKGITHVQ